jgi:small subunit ribosomal protein S19
MVKKAFAYRGKGIEEIKKMSLNEFMKLVPARSRRTLKRGFTEEQKKFIHDIETGRGKLRTHCRDLIVIPVMLGKKLLVYAGNRFEPVVIGEEMLGHRLGEFVLTRKRLKHNAPGIGATKSSGALSVK